MSQLVKCPNCYTTSYGSTICKDNKLLRNKDGLISVRIEFRDGRVLYSFQFVYNHEIDTHGENLYWETGILGWDDIQQALARALAWKEMRLIHGYWIEN